MTWFQLTYASSQGAPGRSGGWDVQQLTPGTPSAIESQMRAGVTTRLESLDALDEFPTTAELAARTRRLSFRFDDDGGSVWWHAVDAGKDATGRPGNVFTHAVGVAVQPDTLRPIDLWHSPCWLMPFGQKEVAAADLGDFESMGVFRREAAMERAFARQEQTEALLSAVATCLDNGWSLVLASGSQDEFAAWLSVVSHLTAANVAAGTLAFSTFDRAARLQQVLEQVTIVGIPMADLAQARGASSDPARHRRLVLDLDNLPSATSDGDWHYAGQRWPSEGLWQEAFFELTDSGRYSRADVASVLALMDERAAAGDNYRAIGAPLAAALLESCPDAKTRDELLEQWSGHLHLAVSAVEALLGVEPNAVAGEPAPALKPDAHANEGSRDVLDFRVSLPAPTEAAEEHLHLAKQVLASADVLQGDQSVRSRVEQWIQDFERRHREKWQPQDFASEQGVTNVRDS